MGMHVSSHTFIDPEALLEEITQSADMLTHGLVCELIGVVVLDVHMHSQHTHAQLR